MEVTLDAVRRLVARQLGRRRVEAGQRLVEDLGAQSVDVVNVIAALEERYAVTIPEGDLPDLETVEDLHRRVRELASD